MCRSILIFLLSLMISITPSFADTDDTFKKAKNGDPKSQVNVGLWYLHGRADKEQDCHLAEKWFIKAARQGYEGGAFYLYAMYSGASINCKEDDVEAGYWLHAAAISNPNYQWVLGQAYRDGLYGLADNDKAIFWLQKAVQQGYTLAERDLNSLLAEIK